MGGKEKLTNDPSEYIRDRGKHARGRQERGEIAHPDRLHRREDDVADAAHERRGEQHEAALLRLVGHVCRDKGGEEGDEVWGRGEALGVEGAVAHVFEDGGQVDGQGGVGDVGAEIH